MKKRKRNLKVSLTIYFFGSTAQETKQFCRSVCLLNQFETVQYRKCGFNRTFEKQYCRFSWPCGFKRSLQTTASEWGTLLSKVWKIRQIRRQISATNQRWKIRPRLLWDTNTRRSHTVVQYGDANRWPWIYVEYLLWCKLPIAPRTAHFSK